MDPHQAYIDEYFEVACRVEYYRAYRDHCRKWTKWIEGLLHLASLSTIAGWSLAQNLGWLWAIVLVAAELVRYFKDFIPHFARLKKLNDAIPALREVEERADKSLFAVLKQEKGPKDIDDLAVDFRQQRNRIEDTYFGDVGLPEKRELANSTAEVVKSRLERRLGKRG
ncbi:MAG: hypothetical protein ACKO1J_17740 [Tagaea sp.]